MRMWVRGPIEEMATDAGRNEALRRIPWCMGMSNDRVVVVLDEVTNGCDESVARKRGENTKVKSELRVGKTAWPWRWQDAQWHVQRGVATRGDGDWGWWRYGSWGGVGVSSP